MIKEQNQRFIAVEGTDGAEIEVEAYERNTRAVIHHSTDTSIIIAINQCESIALNKEDAKAIARKILELANEV